VAGAVDAGGPALVRRTRGTVAVLGEGPGGLVERGRGAVAAVGRPGSAADGSDDEGQERAAVREAWSELGEALPVESPRTSTPGETARRAVAAGLPEEPVATLRDAFREVEYGGRPPEERAAEVREAREALREHSEEPEEGEGP
jgi:hypothetical protein